MNAKVPHAVRLLLNTPGFTLIAIVTLALGIGASTAVFTVVNALLLRPLPYRDSSRLVLVTATDRGQQDNGGCLTYPRYTLIAENARTFGGIAAFAADSANVTNPGAAEQVRAARVSPAFFDVLGVSPAIGRRFKSADEQSGDAVIISDALWKSRFGASRNAIGRAITLDGTSHTVIGVLPAGFTFGLLGSRVDVWTPRIDELSLMSAAQLRSGPCYLNAVARLAGGVDGRQAAAEMDVLNRRYLREFAKLPDADPRRLIVADSLQERVVGSFKPLLRTLLATVAVVLLIACANVASLLLARGLTRRRELAVRTALGASRASVVGQLLIESVMVALAGGIVGTVAAMLGTRPLAIAVEGMLPRSQEIAGAFDPRVLWFGLAVSVVTGIAAGIAPALQVSGGGLLGVLRTDDRGSIGHHRRTVLRNVLVAAQIALSLVLLVAAGLLVRSFWKLQMVAPGFDPRGTLTMNLSLPSGKYAGRVQIVDFYERLIERVSALPGVESASLASALPLNASRMSPVLPEGQPAVPLAERPVVVIQTWLGSHLTVMRIPLVKGRTFDNRDRAGSPAVIIVNQAFARRFFPNADPIGRHVVLGRRNEAAEIVGVVGDVKNIAMTQATSPEIFVPFGQLPWAGMNLTVRARGDAAALAQPVRSAIAALDRDVPVTGVQRMEDVLSAARFQPKVVATLLGTFAACALVLACVGLYGLIAYAVGQRTQELGVRMALGATGRDVTRLVVRQGVILALTGVAAGLAASFVVTRWMASLVFDVSTTDAVTFAASALVFLVLAAVASWIPARRAAGVDPCEALRA